MKLKNKFLKLIGCFLFVASFAITSCDYIDTPIPITPDVGDTASCPTPTFTLNTAPVRKVLVEDYTGHTCPNCPRAAAELTNIIASYPDQVIGVGIHYSTTFAAPQPGLGGDPNAFTTDFRTSAGTTWGDFFMAGAGLPIGTINRMSYTVTATTHRKPDFLWSSLVSQQLAKPVAADIQIKSEFNSVDSNVCITVNTKFLRDTTGTFKLVVIMTQDSIVDWQYDAQASPSVFVQNYIHRHVMRDNISSEWGDNLVSGSITSGYARNTKYKYKIKASYNNIACDISKCHLVAYLYDPSDYEVMQAEEIKIK